MKLFIVLRNDGPNQEIRGIYSTEELAIRAIALDVKASDGQWKYTDFIITEEELDQAFIQISEDILEQTMTKHDSDRMQRAMIHKNRRFNSKEEEMESLLDAIAGLQSTDHPSLCPLHDELMKKLQELRKK